MRFYWGGGLDTAVNLEFKEKILLAISIDIKCDSMNKNTHLWELMFLNTERDLKKIYFWIVFELLTTFHSGVSLPNEISLKKTNDKHIAFICKEHVCIHALISIYM